MSEAPRERGLIAWMARQPIAANLIMWLLLLGGLWTASTVQKEVEPDSELDAVEVSVSYPGASPAEVEQGIVLPVESVVRGIQGIDELTSSASEGSGSVRLQLVAGTDRIKALQDVDQAVSRIRTFPEEAEQPEVRLYDRQRGVLQIELYGGVDIWTLRQLGEQLRDRLLSEPGITQVELGDLPAYETRVEIAQEVLRAHGLTLGEVAWRIRRSASDIPAGTVETHRGEILLRLREQRQWATELAEIPIRTGEAGAVVRLGDIATVRDDFEEDGFHPRFDGVPSMRVSVYRVGQQSPLDIEDTVLGVMEELEATLPPGVQARIDRNQAEDFRDRLDLLVENGFLAVFIVLGILSLFLEARLAFWVMTGMVLSFFGGILLLPWVGVSINMISMFAFLVVLGIVVDDAIVVGENVHAEREAGRPPVEAAVRGARDVAVPVTVAILTNIVAWVPVLFLPGSTGLYWWPLPVVVIGVLAISLFEALYILPAHLAHVRTEPASRLEARARALQEGFSRRFRGAVDRWYRPLLGLCLRNRYLTLAASLALLTVTASYASSDHMGMILMPEVAADEIEAGIRLPVGTTPEQARVVAEEVTRATQRMFEEHDLHEVAEGIKSNVRRGSFIDVELVMRPPDERDMSAKEVIALWREQIGDIEGVDQISFEAERGPGGWRDDIEIDLSHDDMDTLVAATRALKREAETFENTRDVSDSYRKGMARMDVRLRPEGRLLGLDPTAVGQQVRDAFFGALALRFLRGTNEVEVRVRLPEEEREALRTVQAFILRTEDGLEVPLGDVAELVETEAFTSISRRGGRRVLTVSMDVEPKRATTQVLEAIRDEVLPGLRADHPGLTWTFEGTNAEMRESTGSLYASFAMALLVIYGLLAVAFSSWTQPLVVLAAIPFGIVGAVMGHMLLGYDLSIVSLMGVVALSGVVVNDALIMVDHANRHRPRGGAGTDLAAAFDAIHEAGVRRFRPIVLTTLTTFGGLTPIILEQSRQAYHLVPMAISLGFGIVFATGIVLVMVPCLYLVLEDGRRVLGLGEQGDEAATRGA